MTEPARQFGALRQAWAEIDLSAVEHNAALLAHRVAPAALCAVVKADGYGHGAVEVARAALAGGASWLAVALVEEGIALRRAGVAEPVLLLSEVDPEAVLAAVEHGLTPTVYSLAAAQALAEAVRASGRTGVAVHVKVDTGMHRVGASPATAQAVARAVAEDGRMVLEGVWSHFAVADDPGSPFTSEQAERFHQVVDDLSRAGIDAGLRHLCNSAGALAHPSSHLDLVRCGIALYGVAPSLAMAGMAGMADLRPAMSLHARVSMVRDVPEGDGVSYGLNYRLRRPGRVATVPLGYADGVPWLLAHRHGEVLVGGRRRPIAGNVTMDQMMVDCGDLEVAAGDIVTVIGCQGDEEITAWDVASKVSTIAYEVVCGIGPRVPRVHRRGRGGTIAG